MPKTTPANLIQQAIAVAQAAYAPYSQFHVGAAIEMDDGSIFTGCNVENASYGLTICAERNATFAAVAAGKKKIKQVAIVADGDAIPYPCGACRQVLAEFATPDCLVHITPISQPDTHETYPLKELLPHGFSF